MAKRAGRRIDTRPLEKAARRAVEATVRAGAIHYERCRHLPRLIRAVPAEYACEDATTAHAIIGRLEQAISAERRRGRMRHWSYDLNRHIALMQALRAERDALAKTQREELASPDGPAMSEGGPTARGR